MQVGAKNRRARRLGWAVVPAAVLALAVLPASVPAPEPGDPPRTIEVELVDFGFEPSRVAVRPGDRVRFVQSTVTPHNVEFRNLPDGAALSDETLPMVSGEIAVGGPSPAPRMGPYLLAQGAVYEVVIGEGFAAGSYTIVCTPHEAMGMIGELIVTTAPVDDGARR